MGYKLLLADDSITIQKVVGIIFANEDYELTVVDNGDDALEKARQIAPDVILVDALMPGKSGYDVCREARQDPVLKNTPLLLLVGAFEPFDEEKARNSGADDHISKPFESQHLTEKVRKLIELSEERAQTLPAPESESPEADLGAPAVEEMALSPAETVLETASQPDTLGGPAEASETLYLNSLEIVEASPEDDLWGAFEIEEIEEEEEVRLGEVEEEDLQADIIDTVEEIETFSLMEPEAAPYEGENTISLGEVPEDRQEQEEGVEEEFVISEEPEFAEEEEISFAEVNALESPVETAPFVEEYSQEVNLAVPGFADITQTPVEAADLIQPEESPSFMSDMEPAVEEEEGPSCEINADQAAACTEEPSGPVEGTISLSESQLAAIISSVSKEMIEKIAWEVVPELAETIIREEIRKIKEGY